jgi:hydroxymethylglutaryl-CoA lyase
MTLPKRVKLVEVGPRDGLQNEKRSCRRRSRSNSSNVCRCRAVGDRGDLVRVAEVGAADGRQRRGPALAAGEPAARRPGVSYPVLTPNLKGFDAALEAGAQEVAIFAAASETFSQKNINCSIAESLKRFAAVVDAASALGDQGARLRLVRHRLSLRRRR